MPSMVRQPQIDDQDIMLVFGSEPLRTLAVSGRFYLIAGFVKERFRNP